MINAVTRAGNAGGIRNRFGKLGNLLGTFLALVIILLLGFVIWRHFIHKTSTVAPVLEATPSQKEVINKDQTNADLKNKNYTSYQLYQQTLAIQYLVNNDATSAERVMNEVITNVPADKIDSSSYSILYRAEKAKGNIALQKKYLELTISKLKAEGKQDTADAAKKVLDGLK